MQGHAVRRQRFRCPAAVAAVLAVTAALAAALARAGPYPVEAALYPDPSVAVVGDMVTVTLSITVTGVDAFTHVNPALEITSGSELVSITAVPWQSASLYLPSGSTQLYAWTLTVSGTGTVRLTGMAGGYLLGQAYTAVSTAILVIPGPSQPAIRVLNNVLRPGRTATIVLHGSGPGTADLVVHDAAGAPLGRAGTGAVVLDGNGYGSVRFDGTVGNRRLSTGAYWIVASGGVSGRAPVLVTAR